MLVCGPRVVTFTWLVSESSTHEPTFCRSFMAYRLLQHCCCVFLLSRCRTDGLAAVLSFARSSLAASSFDLAQLWLPYTPFPLTPLQLPVPTTPPALPAALPALPTSLSPSPLPKMSGAHRPLGCALVFSPDRDSNPPSQQP